MARRMMGVARMVAGLFCAIAGMGILAFLCTYDPRDPSYFMDVAPFNEAIIHTWGGWWGASIAAFCLQLCGINAFLICPLFLLLACIIWQFAWADAARFGGALLIFFVNLFTGGAVTTDPTIGGYAGMLLYTTISPHSDPFILVIGAPLLFMVGLILLVRFAWVAPICRSLSALAGWIGLTALSSLCVRVFQFAKGKVIGVASAVKALIGAPRYRYLDDECEEALTVAEDPFIPTSIIELSDPMVTDQNIEEVARYLLPRDTLFGEDAIVSHEKKDLVSVEAKKAAHVLEAKLRQFGIEGAVVAISSGPAVTLFSYAPATDVKVSRIVALEDDLALALEARSLRVIAPMPGTAYVGFELAHRVSESVAFVELVRRPTFRDSGLMLPLILGKNSTGDDRVIDLTAQPHLLVAGSTGSGKSVALHTMISGLISSRTPDELRLVLIDPKRLEFAGYADVAHLLVPIVTDGVGACRILAHLTVTMEHRYQQMAQMGVRNIQEFHRVGTVSEMPYIAVVIDELADLMMLAGKDLDVSLARLAQMARAAGIHLIVATQRPSVDVLTGLVKVNFPARIAFKVASKTDARTILDQGGAERLLGRGDMLFLDPRGGLERIQGAFIHDDDVRRIVDCIKAQRSTDYLVMQDEHAMQSGGDEDPLFPQVTDFVRTVDEISISLIQRRFRIGYNRSARIVDQLERQGIILPSQGGKMRRVVRDSSIT